MRKTIIVCIALLTGGVGGCAKPELSSETLPIDVSKCAQPEFVFEAPANLGPVVNSPYDDGSPDISADGLSLYFDSLRPDGAGSWDIWVTKRETVDSEWGSPEPLGSLINTQAGESGPCISPDGLSLYFASNRPGGQGDYDIWLATRKTTDEPWEEPVNLGPALNSWAYDNHPSISADGLSLYFDSRRPNASGSLGNNDLYVTKRQSLADGWGIPVNLGATINTSNIEYSPYILPDGLTLFFDSRITDRDLWMATRKSAADDWAQAASLGPPMNTRYIDTDPTLWVDGCIIYFVSTRPGGIGRFDIWQSVITKGQSSEEKE